MFVVIDDADGETRMTLEEAQRAGWGLVRLYGEESMKDVDAFTSEMLAAAAAARELFLKRVAKARKKFHQKYPKGLLPDEEADAPKPE